MLLYMFILVLILGHGQFIEEFKPKTRYVQQAFRTLFEGMDLEFEFLSGTFPAYPDEEDKDHQRVWGYGEPDDKIRGLETSIWRILDFLYEKGPFIGIVGFSSGAAMAAIITSILEKTDIGDISPWKVSKPKFIGLDYLAYASFQVNHQKLHFTVCLSGFRLDNKCYDTFYSPNIETPIFHTVGELDSMISSTQTENLMRCCKRSWLFEFFGGHYVPQSKEFLEFSQSLASFLRSALRYYLKSQVTSSISSF